MTSTHKIATVSYAELQDAFDFVSAAAPLEHNAYLALDSGKIYWFSDLVDTGEEDLPEDLENAGRYLPIPHKNDFNLGRELVLSFVDQALPDDYSTVAAYFHKRGAYGHFKDLLQTRKQLEHWYRYEEAAVKQALHEWCAENGVKLAPAA
ncbi:MAG: hypothetical protein HYZ65_11125 [Burkholderiales bacterium]|nr:hypothetical protein [Burkholderiales bacterium]